jgi:hypothetical protein
LRLKRSLGGIASNVRKNSSFGASKDWPIEAFLRVASVTRTHFQYTQAGLIFTLAYIGSCDEERAKDEEILTCPATLSLVPASLVYRHTSHKPFPPINALKGEKDYPAR